jgi:hypothetical protein
MRDFKGMKRQRGRNRGGGGKPQQQNANRAFDSNGPDGVKVRGNAQHVFEKYQQLARDASSAGDRILAENYLQHSEHYFRLVRAMQPTKPAAEILRDNYSSGMDVDFEDESGAQAAAEADAAAANAEAEGGQTEGSDGDNQQPRGERWRDDRQRDDRPRSRDRWRDRDERRGDDRQRDDRQRDDRPRDERPRDDRPREDRQRDDRPRGDREDRQPREDRQRDRYENRRDREDRGERQERDPLAVVEPQAAPLLAKETPAPSPVLRDEDGGESHAPAFLKAPRAPRAPKAETPAADGEEKPKTRRRRAPRSFEGGEASSNETEEA